ncbi:hypothetical protein Pcinc_032225 [Petrolisthes cinctipes]|uniref:Uncharacterized protein n=1 Tax=Petrolisthes cinctipes TaxID=88211 RepID=A0AAE1EV22_PETCI|nr:hypothetical protein Pcinc_032225 [Petrolisthes cinctipes]
MSSLPPPSFLLIFPPLLFCLLLFSVPSPSPKEVLTPSFPSYYFPFFFPAFCFSQFLSPHEILPPSFPPSLLLLRSLLPCLLLFSIPSPHEVLPPSFPPSSYFVHFFPAFCFSQSPPSRSPTSLLLPSLPPTSFTSSLPSAFLNPLSLPPSYFVHFFLLLLVSSVPSPSMPPTPIYTPGHPPSLHSLGYITHRNNLSDVRFEHQLGDLQEPTEEHPLFLDLTTVAAVLLVVAGAVFSMTSWWWWWRLLPHVDPSWSLQHWHTSSHCMDYEVDLGLSNMIEYRSFQSAYPVLEAIRKAIEKYEHQE